jgi:hypothetical protein
MLQSVPVLGQSGRCRIDFSDFKDFHRQVNSSECEKLARCRQLDDFGLLKTREKGGLAAALL